MQTKRIAAAAVASAVLVGSIGFASVNSRISEQQKKELNEQTVSEYSYEYGTVQNLWFKLNELWRLSINSDLDMEIVNAISVLNSSFDSELLMKAIKAEGDGIIDEYIYSVLAGLDFELYLNDREAYDKAKADAAYTGEVLTAEKIDEYLNRLNEETAKQQINNALDMPSALEIPNNAAEMPQVPEVPTAESIMPENPADAVKRETEAITNHAFGIEVK